MVSGFCPDRFGVMVCSVVLGRRYIPQTTPPCSGWCKFFICGCVIVRFVAVLCPLYKIKCNPMHFLYGVLPMPYVPVQVALDTLVLHRFTYVHDRCRTSKYRIAFVSLSVSLWNDFDGGDRSSWTILMARTILTGGFFVC